MKRLALLLTAFLLTACASTATPPPGGALFHDSVFAPPSVAIDARDIFALTPEMRHYLTHKVKGQSTALSPQQALFDALFTEGELRLDYDASVTRNAADTFRTRSGNCLSLVIMTAAMARELGLSVYYRQVDVPDAWMRSGSLMMATDHVNLSLEKPMTKIQGAWDSHHAFTVDFLPPEQTRGQRYRIIGESTVVAMFMNNRAAELLAQGEIDNAYWFAREAVRQDPGYLSAYNTLGVVYRKAGRHGEAEAVFRTALQYEPDNTVPMFNLMKVLENQGRDAEAARLAGRLQQLQPHPPYHFYHLGRAALDRGDASEAIEQFRREVARDPLNAEFRYWLAMAYAQAGKTADANEQLRKAVDNSATTVDRQRYASKLERLRALSVRN